MKQYFLKTLLLLLLPLLSQGGNITLSGRVNKPETLIRLMFCDDLLNGHETEAARTTSDAKGFFLLEAQTGHITPARILVGLEGVDLIVTPGASYELSITVPDIDPSQSYFERPMPSMRIKTATDKGIYRQIVVSENIINDYVLNCFDQLYRRRQYRYLDSIRNAIDANLDIKEDYVLQYNTYKIASVQLAVNADGGKKVIGEYYDGKPVLYDCQPYMDLFKDLFVNKFWQAPYTIDGFENAFWEGPEALKTYLASDPLMKNNPRLAELVTIYNLKNMYYEQVKLRKVVKDHLKAIRADSKFAETKKLVENMLAEFDRLAMGAPAVDFELTDVSGKTVKLSDFKDRMVLLQFVEGGSATVDHQFEVLSDLHRQWQDSVQLVTITTKDQLASHRKRFEEHRYDWPLLNLGNDVLLLEAYNVRTFPEYVLVIRGTRIGQAPAPSPERYLDDRVRQLYGK